MSEDRNESRPEMAEFEVFDLLAKALVATPESHTEELVVLAPEIDLTESAHVVELHEHRTPDDFLRALETIRLVIVEELTEHPPIDYTHSEAS